MEYPLLSQGVNWTSLTAVQKSALSAGALAGLSFLENNNPSSGDSDLVNTTSLLVTGTDWATYPLIGSADNSIDDAAIVALYYIGANIPAEAVYWQQTKDNCGDSLEIGKNYVFNLTSSPPYKGFWSLTVYNSTGTNGLINTTNNTYTLGSQFPNLSTNSEGGATLYLSQSAPSESLQSNWLPLGVSSTNSTTNFILIFRIYSPNPPNVIYDYSPPAIRVTDDNFSAVACPSV